MYYKGTKKQCNDYNQKVYNGTESMKDDIFTNSYASILEIENQFYILNHEDFNSNMDKVSELPIDPNNTQP
jgi:hypothetical protein